MQVKNFYWYVLNKPLGSTEALTEKLSKQPFSPCASQQVSSQGWVAPFASSELLYEAHGAQLIMLKQEKRLLPASVVNDYLQEKIEAFEAAEGYKPSRKVRTQMKEDLTLELLPKAFTKSMGIPVLILPRKGWLFVLAASSKTADDVTGFLRETLGSLPISLMSTDMSPAHCMTTWLSSPGELPAQWTLGEEVELQDAEGAVVKVRNQDLLADELQVHLDAGKIVSKLALNWSEHVSLMLQDDLAVKRIKLILEEQESLDSSEGEEAKFAHEFALSCNWLQPLCESLLQALGGLEKALGASQSRAFSQ